MTLRIQTQSGKYYDITDTGDIKRLDIPDFVPSGDWKMRGIRSRKCRHTVLTVSQLRRAYGPSEMMPTPKPELLYKNGKPRWDVLDIDHGTWREWSDGIVNIWKVA